MAWLGRTIEKLDFRKELTNYINGQPTPNRVCITNQSGDIDSSVTTVAELAFSSTGNNRDLRAVNKQN